MTRGDQGTTLWWKDKWTARNTSVRFHYTGWITEILTMSHSNPPTEANPLPCTNQPKRCFCVALMTICSWCLVQRIQLQGSLQHLLSWQWVWYYVLSPTKKRKMSQLSQHPWPWRHCQHVPFKITELSAICGDGSLSQSLMLFYVWLSQSSSSDISKPHIK